MLIVLLCALLLDYFLGEPKKYHPLVGFGQLATALEARLNDFLAESNSDLSAKQQHQKQQQNRINGLIALLFCLLPAGWLGYFITSEEFLSPVFEILILYLALGLNSLKEHAQNILSALKENNLPQARQALALIVSRDTQEMTDESIARATTESVLENGSDAVFATIFWFMVAGAPGVIIFRLSNTLDAMWGYKTPRYNNFGFFAAKFDDLLNYIPARLSALSYALMGNWDKATKCWMKQGTSWESPNAGVVMAAGAGALNVQLGGADYYHGEYKPRPDLGCGQKATADTIQQACLLLDRVTLLWIIFAAVITISAWL